jgi:4-hydroxy-4-methyl-2-oxoglutarate aldolase
MNHEEIERRFAMLSTPNLADACLRAGVAVRCGPHDLRAVVPGSQLAGRVLPAAHVGSVDVLLEAIEGAGHGDVLVVDNAGRRDEACVGDLMIHEAHGADLAGVVIWGLHRDTRDLVRIGLPVFSLGPIATGPLHFAGRAADALAFATVGQWPVGRDDLVLGDDDGVLFLPAAKAPEIFTVAESIRDTENRQAEQIAAGQSLRSQVRFDVFLARRKENPTLTFREHLRTVGGAIEV